MEVGARGTLPEGAGAPHAGTVPRAPPRLDHRTTRLRPVQGYETLAALGPSERGLDR